MIKLPGDTARQALLCLDAAYVYRHASAVVVEWNGRQRLINKGLADAKHFRHIPASAQPVNVKPEFWSW